MAPISRSASAVASCLAVDAWAAAAISDARCYDGVIGLVVVAPPADLQVIAATVAEVDGLPNGSALGVRYRPLERDVVIEQPLHRPLEALTRHSVGVSKAVVAAAQHVGGIDVAVARERDVEVVRHDATRMRVGAARALVV